VLDHLRYGSDLVGSRTLKPRPTLLHHTTPHDDCRHLVVLHKNSVTTSMTLYAAMAVTEIWPLQRLPTMLPWYQSRPNTHVSLSFQRTCPWSRWWIERRHCRPLLSDRQESFQLLQTFLRSISPTFRKIHHAFSTMQLPTMTKHACFNCCVRTK